MKIEKSSSDLEAEVIFRDLCAHCGTCGAFCPHIKYKEDGLPVVQDACNETLGVCYNSCPRTNFSVSSLENKMFGKLREDPILGVYSSKIVVESKKGSILNNLIDIAIKSKIVEGAVVPDPEKRTKKPVNNVAMVVKDASKLPELTGKNLEYTGPLVVGINDAFEMGLKSVALVGNPCHLQGATKIYYSDFNTNVKTLGLKIGIMCASGGADGCKYCTDYSGEFSDISYSEMGAEKDQAILIVRTELGQKLLDAAIKDKVISKVSDEPNLEKVLKFATNKKQKNVKNLLKKDLGKIGYLELNQEELNTYFGS